MKDEAHKPSGPTRHTHHEQHTLDKTSTDLTPTQSNIFFFERAQSYLRD